MSRIKHILPLFLSMLTVCGSAKAAMPWIKTSADTLTHKHQTTNGILNHMDLGVNVGTTGLGLTVSMPIGDRLRVRTGVDYMPRTSVPMSFELMSYSGLNAVDKDEQKAQFDRLSELMYGFTGYKIDRSIDMRAHGTTVDFKLLVDFYPLRNNRHWSLTAGFFWGSAKVGHIENTIYEAPSLMGVNIYNHMYDYFMTEEYLYTPIYVHPTAGEMYIDPDQAEMVIGGLKYYGRVGGYLGRFNGKTGIAEGTPYLVFPDENGTLQADMYVNHFKPYAGISYTTTISKDGRWNLGFDAGALFWGRPTITTRDRYYQDEAGNTAYGTPYADSKLTYGDYVDVGRDVTGTPGKVGDYVSIAKAMHVYPVLNFRLTYKLF